ncbi:hypothetical protein [Corallococcus sp. RDP092CA]
MSRPSWKDTVGPDAATFAPQSWKKASGSNVRCASSSGQPE